ncbi:adenylate cyclase [Morganella morganii]|uniref:Adenylate cyclase n=1 Tax=Morganella morganii TaxID=582 RepID=A0A0D8LBR4_MORMO|nr:adenylate cyclase [Morganella morganii]
MLNTTEKITYRNGFMHNGDPTDIETIRPIFEGRRAAALSVWEQYEQMKAKLLQCNLTPEQYQHACRDIARALGV